MIRPLTPERAAAVLKAGHVGRLGCIVDDAPYVVPINYVFDCDSIYSHSLPGTKIDAMRADPRACLQVDDIADDCHWKSVMARGRYEEVSDRAESDRFRAALLSHLPGLTPVESLRQRTPAQGAPIVFRIRIDEVTGVGEW